MHRLLTVFAVLAFCSSASAATYCRPIGGRLIDCYAAESAATLEARMGVSGFVAVPDGTRSGSAVTFTGGGAIDTITPPPDPPAPQAQPIPQSPANVIALIIAVIGSDAWADAWTDTTHKPLVAARSMLLVSQDVLPGDPKTLAGLDAIVAAGYMSSAQKAAVLAAWPNR